jgi:hypothetical protein
MVAFSIYEAGRYGTAAEMERRQRGEDIEEIRDRTAVWVCFDRTGAVIRLRHVTACTRRCWARFGDSLTPCAIRRRRGGVGRGNAVAVARERGARAGAWRCGHGGVVSVGAGSVPCPGRTMVYWETSDKIRDGRQ